MKLLLLIVGGLLIVCHSWKTGFGGRKVFKASRLRAIESENIQPVVNTEEIGSLSGNSIDVPEKSADSEELLTVYPFNHLGLPVLKERNNFFCGKYRDYFWHQDNRQVLAYLPVDDSVTRHDVETLFEAERVEVHVNGKLLVEFTTPYPISPSACFWVIESDTAGQRYIQLDMEKRFSYTNWRYLFVKKVFKQQEADAGKVDLLEKMYAANVGMSKLSGQPPQSMDSMKENGIFNELSSREELEASGDQTMFTKSDSGLRLVPYDEDSPDVVRLVDIMHSKKEGEFDPMKEMLEEQQRNSLEEAGEDYDDGKDVETREVDVVDEDEQK